MAAEADSAKTKKAEFSMYWYWTGEATLGRVPGILSSRIGHLDVSEIVEVEYDTTKTDLAQLVFALREESSFYAVITNNENEFLEAKKHFHPSEVKKVSADPHFIESKYSLRTQHPDLYYLDLNEQQAIALNSWSYFGGEMPNLLTDAQKERREQLKSKLRSEKPSALHPVRSGRGLEKYRQQLLHWIKNWRSK